MASFPEPNELIDNNIHAGSSLKISEMELLICHSRRWLREIECFMIDEGANECLRILSCRLYIPLKKKLRSNEDQVVGLEESMPLRQMLAIVSWVGREAGWPGFQGWKKKQKTEAYICRPKNTVSFRRKKSLSRS